MQTCLFCQAPLQPGQAFCGACGRLQPEPSGDQATVARSFPGSELSGADSGATLAALGGSRCPTCGYDTPAGATICPRCGQPLATPDSSAATIAGTPPPPPPPPPAGMPSMPGMPGGSQPWQSPPSGSQPWQPSGPQPWSSPSGPNNVPVAPGWAPSGSQPWQQPTVGWQPTGQQPWPQSAPVMAPPIPGGPGMPGATGRKGNTKKLLIIIGSALAVVLLLGAGTGLLLYLTRPQPVLTISGPTTSGSVPAGSPDQIFQVSGQKFSHNEAITLLLDGRSAPGAPSVQSDAAGSFTVSLTITDDWLAGRHTLTAHDTSGYVTKNQVQLAVLPAPVIQVTSNYQAGSTSAGSNGTSFSVTGKRFALHSSITFLLDGQPIPGAQATQSDERGRVSATLTVTGNWALGNHTITAKDDQGDTTQQGQAVAIVHQGEAGTPGPNGAPADNASFTVSVSGSATESDGYQFNVTNTLRVTGQADPAGGKVCGVDDDGQPHTFNGSIRGSSDTYTETIIFSCSGSYKSGHLTYTETAISDQTTVSNGAVCSTGGSYIYQQLDGTFTSQSSISGTYRDDYYRANCSDGTYLYRNPATGNWTGTQY